MKVLNLYAGIGGNRKLFKEFDFIWSSPPCPTHSKIRQCGVYSGRYEAKYSDMKLYEEIILLKYFSPKSTKWVVENVQSYYEPLIPPQELERHYFWANFYIGNCGYNKRGTSHNDITGKSSVYGIDLSKVKMKTRKDMVLRNMVNPELGLHILNESQKITQQSELFE